MDSETYAVTSRVDMVTTEYIEQTTNALCKIIQAKVEINRRKNALEDQIDWLKHQNTTCDSNITVLQEENARLEAFVQESQGRSTDLTEDNLDTLVHPSDPFSEK